MSGYFSKKYDGLTPYTPGEQPPGRTFVKLNTNESPFPPSEKILKGAFERCRSLNLYPDPECLSLREAIAARYGVGTENVAAGNGSDELLNFAFMAFCDDARSAIFPDVTYGFYPVFAALNRVPYREIPLKEGLKLDPDDYVAAAGTCFIANPNAPTGRALEPEEIERIIASDLSRIVVVDEAYVDFGAKSCVPLTKKYENLLVVHTFSKSASAAGARIGFAIGNKGLIEDINTLRFSTNPYNVNSFSLALGTEIMNNYDEFEENCAAVIKNREYTVRKLETLGFEVIPSSANFVFAKKEGTPGSRLKDALKDRGVLVRHFDLERIKDYNRITIGTKEQTDVLFEKIKEILDEEKRSRN